LARYAPVRKIEYRKASCEVEIDWQLSGSILKGDVAAHCNAVRTRVHVESSSPPHAVASLVAMAKNGCFVEQMITTAVPVTSTLTVNSRDTPIPGQPTTG
jgi:hypothetical protein